MNDGFELIEIEDEYAPGEVYTAYGLACDRCGEGVVDAWERRPSQESFDEAVREHSATVHRR